MSSHTRANSPRLWHTRKSPRAVYEQLRRLHYVGTFDNFVEPAVPLAAKIAELAPGGLSHVMYVSGGSEAVEAALKLAKQYQIHERPQAARLQDHLTLERLSRRDDGRAFGDRLARHPPHLRARRAGHDTDPRPDPLPQSVRHARRRLCGLLRRHISSSRSCTKDRTTSRPSSPSRSCRRMACRSRRRTIFRACARSATATACSSSSTR